MHEDMLGRLRPVLDAACIMMQSWVEQSGARQCGLLAWQLAYVVMTQSSLLRWQPKVNDVCWTHVHPP